MNFLNLLLITLVQFLLGSSILLALNIRLSRLQQITLSIVIGLAIMSIIPCIMQLAYIPLTVGMLSSITAALCIILVLINVKKIKHIKIETRLPKVTVYELPMLLFVLFLVSVSFYFSYYMAPTPRDLLSGPEPIAEFALKEHSFINSVFEQDMPYNNGPFKSLYIPSLQLIYKLIGFPFGKIWIAVLSSSFILFLYSNIRNRVNPMIAGFIMVMFILTPEMYAYTYLVLYDYSNMVFYFLSLYFLYSYLKTSGWQSIVLSIFFMSIAAYVRPETFIISAFVSTFGIAYSLYHKQFNIKKSAPITLISAFAGVVYFFTSYLYLNKYLPVLYNVENTINNDLTNLKPLFTRLYDIADKLIYSEYGTKYWGYIFYIFAVMFILEIAMYRKLRKNAAFWLGMLATTYFSIAFIGYLLPLADLSNTSKRAFFKIIPLIVMYFAHSNITLVLSQKINNYLEKQPANLPLPKSNKRHRKKKLKVSN